MTDRERAEIPRLWFPLPDTAMVDVWRQLLTNRPRVPVNAATVPCRGVARLREWSTTHLHSLLHGRDR